MGESRTCRFTRASGTTKGESIIRRPDWGLLTSAGTAERISVPPDRSEIQDRLLRLALDPIDYRARGCRDLPRGGRSTVKQWRLLDLWLAESSADADALAGGAAKARPSPVSSRPR